MTVSYVNPHVAEKCRILAGMEPGKWYGFGELRITDRSAEALCSCGLLNRNRPSRYKRNFEYILTPSGEKMSALLKQIGVS